MTRYPWVWIFVLTMLAAGPPGRAQTLRYPPNASADLCLVDPTATTVSSVPLPLASMPVRPSGADTVIVSVAVTNHCSTPLRVSGLVPHIAPGDAIEPDARIEIAVISRDADDLSVYTVSALGTLAAFDVPQNAQVLHEVVVRLTSGTSEDAVAASASSPLGYVLLNGVVLATGVGVRAVCVHYADRPCGAFQ